MNRLVLKRRLVPYLFIFPFFALFTAFWLAPIVSSFAYSFTNWGITATPAFVGIRNYLQLFSDSRFHVALRNTGLFAVVYNIIMLSLALFIALLLDRVTGVVGKIFRTIYLFPVTLSLVSVALIFDFFLAKDVGLLNSMIKQLNLGPGIDWLGSPSFALWSIVLMRVWRATGYYAVIIFAGLQSIPKELYEAARIDGANECQVVLRIVLPLLKPVLFFALAMSTIWSFKVFDEPWVLTGGGPARSTLTLGIYIYQEGLLYMKLGYAAAASCITTVMVIAVSILQGKLMQEV